MLLIGLAVAAAACSTSNADPASGRGDSVTVVRALDGDSLLVELNGTDREVRLLGINAPERGECFDQESKARLSELTGDRVRLTGDDEDRFGRLLRYAYDGSGSVINQQLIAEGLALALTTDHALLEEFKQAEAVAFEARLGRWQPEACGPATEGDLAIADLRPDAPGNDAANANWEWIEIANRSAAGVDLTGWTVQDESSSHRFTFPDGHTLPPGARVRILSGCGTPDTSTLFWCNDDPVWTNRGDTAYLLDPSGNVVDRWAF
jgi:endonuclease YncB( thermonuclease family)